MWIGLETNNVGANSICLEYIVIEHFVLRWSHDGKFFARMTTDTLSIYETPVSRLTPKTWSSVNIQCASDITATFLLLSVYGLA